MGFWDGVDVGAALAGGVGGDVRRVTFAVPAALGGSVVEAELAGHPGGVWAVLSGVRLNGGPWAFACRGGGDYVRIWYRDPADGLATMEWAMAEPETVEADDPGAAFDAVMDRVLQTASLFAIGSDAVGDAVPFALELGG